METYRKCVVLGILLPSLLSLGCGGSGGSGGTTTSTTTTTTLASIAVNPANASIVNGTNQQFAATGTYSDQSTQDITNRVIWSSSDLGVATISGSQGLATSVSSGVTNIIATLGSISGSTTLTVTTATLESIAITPTNPSIANGTDQPFTATGTYSDNSTQDLTDTVTWSSFDLGIATISGSQGLATSVNPGSTSITATLGNISGSTTLTVTTATLESIAVTPINPSIVNGTDQSFTATGTYSDNSIQDLTDIVTWSSSNLDVATTSGSQGLATGENPGTTIITAMLENISGSTTLKVTAATLESIAVTPTNPSIVNGTDNQFTATGTYSNNSTQDLTDTVTWSSSDLDVATTSGSQAGLATGANPGAAVITAMLGSISGSTTLTVTAATLESIVVTPTNRSIPLGRDNWFVATGTYSNGSTQDVTNSVTWSSSDTGIAEISNARGSNGLAKSVSPGTTDITATLGSIRVSTTLVVTDATLDSIVVTPSNSSIADGYQKQFTATGIYSDNSTQDLTNRVTWRSSNQGRAKISNARGSNGLATSVSPGTTTITATIGSDSGSATLKITNAVPISIIVEPTSASMAAPKNFAATGNYSDESTQNLTNSVTWSSSNTKVATISNASGSKGLVTPESQGSTTIHATLGNLDGRANVTVVAPKLLSITISPRNDTRLVGTTGQLIATGTYSYGPTRDITNSVAWHSSNTDVATINNTSGARGEVTGVTASITRITVTAMLGSKSGKTTLKIYGCGKYGGPTAVSSVYSSWNGSTDRDEWFTTTTSGDSRYCYRFITRTDFRVKDWGSADSYNIAANYDDSVKTPKSTRSECLTSNNGGVETEARTIGRGKSGALYRAAGRVSDFANGRCGRGDPRNNLEGTIEVQLIQWLAPWVSP